jgi:hypothetical protein
MMIRERMEDAVRLKRFFRDVVGARSGMVRAPRSIEAGQIHRYCLL